MRSLMRDWVERLDDRIDRCPGCDQWRWDRRCRKCDEQQTNEEEVTS
jgi:hypothetical protein